MKRIICISGDAASGKTTAAKRVHARPPNLIAEARLVGYLTKDMPDALRVFCECPLEVRAARFREREPDFSQEEAMARVSARDHADTENFRHLYGIDYHDPSYYDLIVSTSNLDPDQVADAIIRSGSVGRGAGFPPAACPQRRTVLSLCCYSSGRWLIV